MTFACLIKFTRFSLVVSIEQPLPPSVCHCGINPELSIKTKSWGQIKFPTNPKYIISLTLTFDLHASNKIKSKSWREQRTKNHMIVFYMQFHKCVCSLSVHVCAMYIIIPIVSLCVLMCLYLALKWHFNIVTSRTII